MPAFRRFHKKYRPIEADFPDSDRHASRLRCLELTGWSKRSTAKTLTSLIKGCGSVDPEDVWAPHGENNPEEPRLDETAGLIKDPDLKNILRKWWVFPDSKFRTPPWDIASTCTVDARPGILLIEAKAHLGELNSDRISTREKRNVKHIQSALDEAAEGWNNVLEDHTEQRGFKRSHKVKLTTHAHYTLSSQFAFAWKLAALGVPVILVYLGFLNALEPDEKDTRISFSNHTLWSRCVFEKTSKPLPEEIWDETFMVNGTPLTILRRSIEVDIPAATVTTHHHRL